MKITMILLALFAVPAMFLAQSLSGTYTINSSMITGGTNFQTFREAAVALNTNGVSGPVTFNVEQGTYLDSLDLNDVTGASTTNRLIFRSAPTNTAPVILRSASNTSSTATVKLNSTKFISFREIEFETSGTTYRRLIYLLGTLSDLRFEDCIFRGPAYTTSSTFFASVYGTSTTVLGEGIAFHNCTATDNAYFYYNTGVSATHSTKLSVTNCQISQGGTYAIYTSYVDTLIVKENMITPTATSNSAYGVYAFNGTTSPAAKADIQKNQILANTTSTFYGVYLTYFNATVEPSIVANNFIFNNSTGGTGTRYGLYLTANANMDVVHNTVRITDGSTTSSRGLYLLSSTSTNYTPGNLRVQNNIFYNEVASTSGALMYVPSGAVGYFGALSNNVYFAPNASAPFYWGSGPLADFPSWTAASNETNSHYGDPHFLSATDCHVDGIVCSATGTNLTFVTEDIDGDARPLAPQSVVDIGADEFAPPPCATPASLAWTQGGLTTADFSWFSGPDAVSWILEYGPINFTPGTGTQVGVPTNPAGLTGLQPNQFYELYVRSYCGVGDTSGYSNPVTFNTFNQGSIHEYNFECYPAGFVDIQPTGIADQLLADGEIGFLLPFPLLIQNEPVTSITIGNNGVVLFNTANGVVSPTNSNTINTTALPGVYPFWDDLDDTEGSVYYQTMGVAPNRTFIVQWNKQHDAFNAGDTLRFQVIFEETTNDIYYVYDNTVVGSTTYDNGGSATIGLVGYGQRIPLSYNNNGFLSANNCVHFYHTNCTKVEDLVLQYVIADEAGLSWSAGAIVPNGYTLVYGPTGFDPSTSGSTLSTSNPSIILSNLDQATTYDVYVYADCNPEQSVGTMMTFTTLPFCSNPESIAMTVAPDSILSSWDWTQFGAYAATGFELMVDFAGFDLQTSGTAYPVDANFTDTLFDASLMAGGVYDVYLRAVCNNFSSMWQGPITLTMPLTNDSVCGAEMLQVDGGTYLFSNAGATVEVGESAIAPPATGAQTTTGWINSNLDKTTWFTFQAPTSGNLRVNGLGTGYNGQMAVYDVQSCGQFTSFTLLAANDDEVDGLSASPNFTVCGLTPGATYYLLHDAFGTATGTYNITLESINLEAGVAIPLQNICYGENIHLFSGLTGHQQGGTWYNPANFSHIYNDSMFSTTGLITGIFTFEYRLEDGCAVDSELVTFEVYPESTAGTGSAVNVCKNEPISLLNNLSGTIDLSGQWYNPNGQPVNAFINHGVLNIAGNYNYKYVVGNGVCPDDSTVVNVIVSNTCDWLGIETAEMQEVVLYPNPAESFIRIAGLRGDVELQWIDATGRTIQTTKAYVKDTEEIEVSVENLHSGTYFLRVIHVDGAVLKRFSKQ